MKLLGITLREINLRREDLEGDLKIKNVNNNINIVNIKLKDVPIGESGKALIFTFEYVTDYELDSGGSFGRIKIVGDVAFTDKKKVLDDIIKSWKKNKKIEEDVLFPVLQVSLNTVNVEAIYLSKKVMLPSPIRLPQINPPKKKKD